MTHVVSLMGKLSKIEVILQNLAVEAVLFWSYFLRKSDIFFSKIRKKWNKKNWKKIEKERKDFLFFFLPFWTSGDAWLPFGFSHRFDPVCSCLILTGPVWSCQIWPDLELLLELHRLTHKRYIYPERRNKWTFITEFRIKYLIINSKFSFSGF